MASTTQLCSYWFKSHAEKYGRPRTYPKITRDIPDRYDVAVIGAGWFGLNTALKLHEQGKKIIVIEASKVGQGTANNSTAKISSQHQIKYTNLIKKHGKDLAFNFGTMNEEAILDIENTIKKYNIPCDWKRAAHIVFAEESGKEFDEIKAEAMNANLSGLKASFQQSIHDDAPSTIQHYGAMRVDDQAFMNTYSYLVGIADALHNGKVEIYEDSRIGDISFGAPHKLTTVDGHKIEAQKVVVATHLPIIDRSGHFSLVEPSRSYCIAVTLTDESKMIKEMYINENSSKTISLRPTADGKVLILCGGGHSTGEIPKGDPSTWGYGAVESWARKHFPVKEVIAKWSAMDYYPADKIPYIGLAHHGSDSLYVATGFGKWGFTQGMAAAQIVTDLILGNPNKYARYFDARRWDLTHTAMTAAMIQAHVTKHFVGDRISHIMSSNDIEDLVPGEGAICKDGIVGTVAAFRDEQGVIHKFDPKCTHLGCHVNWNPQNKNFECPCHGSVFTGTGEVLHGPTTLPLKKK